MNTAIKSLVIASCLCHFSAVAAADEPAEIRSYAIGSLMRLPDWMPTEVPPEWTFGSVKHTNQTKRITTETLAAVESIFEAYYERMLFMSEGRSNNWNVAKFGPRPTAESSLDQVEFTNDTESASSIFVYRSAETNQTEYPRLVASSRRLFEFDNIFRLADTLKSNIFNSPDVSPYRGVFLPYCPTWYPYELGSQERMVYLGSSWIPGEPTPPPVGGDWHVGLPTMEEFCVTNCCLPIWEMGRDSVIKTDYNEYAKDQLNFLHLKWLEKIDFGEMLDGTGEGYLDKLRVSRPWILEQTITSLITNRFPMSGPGRSIDTRTGGYTRRFMPDDFLEPVLEYAGGCVITNAFKTNSSHVATMSRLLSLLDRSYEVARISYQPDYEKSTVSSNEVTTVYASSTATGTAPIVHGNTNQWERSGSNPNSWILTCDAGEEVYFEFSQGPVERIRESTITSGNAYGTFQGYRYSGTESRVQGPFFECKGFRAYIKTNDQNYAEYIASMAAATSPAGYLYHVNYNEFQGGFTLTSEAIGSGETFTLPISIETYGTPRIVATITVSQNATLSVTTPAYQTAIDYIYPYYGPGSLSFSSGRVKDCQSALAASIRKIVGKRNAEGVFDRYAFPGIEDRLYSSLYSDTSKYSITNMWACHLDYIRQNESVVRTLASALSASGWARAKLHETCREDIEGDPLQLNPILDNVLKSGYRLSYNGGFYYLNCEVSGKTVWPAEGAISFGFSGDSTSSAPEVDVEKAFTAPVAADLFISDPMICTEWAWKALQTVEKNKD